MLVFKADQRLLKNMVVVLAAKEKFAEAVTTSYIFLYGAAMIISRAEFERKQLMALWVSLLNEIF